jgi:adenosylmethionine-8-amino-7-oxononanoate transaminase
VIDKHPGRVWLPFTQMATFSMEARTFERAQGVTLIDARGHETFDAVSSIWTCIHGHCHPKIVEAIASQAARLDHATMLGATNPQAEALAERLCSATGMSHVFYASDGASAVEAALKLARQFWVNVGQPGRRRFVHLRSSYHGDTIGAMSVSDIDVFRRPFDDLCFESISYEHFAACGDLSDVAAVIVEPKVQAAAGMRLVPDDVYASLRHIDTLLIVDEIATGFGRTGDLFAVASLAVEPDILCVGKGLTGGALALSGTLTTDRIYDAFLSASTLDARHFFHGHSYAGNPIACAAAIASFDLFATEGTLARVAELARHLDRLAGRFATHEQVAEIRQAGLMCGIELRVDPDRPVRSASRAWDVANALYDHGHFTRPIGDVIQLVPPLTSMTRDLDSFCEALEDALR